MFQIDFTSDILEDLQLFRACEQRQMIEPIEIQLPYQVIMRAKLFEYEFDEGKDEGIRALFLWIGD